MQKKGIFRFVYTGLVAALVFSGTQFMKVPLPFGYVHAGDCFVILAGYLIGGGYAVAAAVIGSVLADILSGYAIYIPATLLIKTLMVLIVILMNKPSQSRGGKKGKLVITVTGTGLAEAVMVIGYFLYDAVVFGVGGALASLGGNVVQGFFGVVGSIVLITVMHHSGLRRYL